MAKGITHKCVQHWIQLLVTTSEYRAINEFEYQKWIFKGKIVMRTWYCVVHIISYSLHIVRSFLIRAFNSWRSCLVIGVLDAFSYQISFLKPFKSFLLSNYHALFLHQEFFITLFIIFDLFSSICHLLSLGSYWTNAAHFLTLIIILCATLHS